MNGKISVAPCGHTGETVIGTYVKCLQGCDGGVKSIRRGEVGHVENCACKPCQLRRITQTIVIKAKNGDVITTVPWDGASDEIQFMPDKDYWAADYQMLDKDGKIIASGPLMDGLGGPIGIVGGWPARLRTKFLMDKAGFVVEVSQSVRTFDPKSVVVTFKGIELKPYTPDDDTLLWYAKLVTDGNTSTYS